MKKLFDAIKKTVKYIFDDKVDIRVRLIFITEYALIFAFIVATVNMIIIKEPFYTIIPNFFLMGFVLLGLYLSHAHRKYELSSTIIIITGAYIILPYMYFVAGGVNSGMITWFLFGVIYAVLMSKGIYRVIYASLAVLVDIACVLVSLYKPEWVIPLNGGEKSVIMDIISSFIVVSIGIGATLIVYISSYDRQKRLLEAQGRELIRMMQTDELTGLYNRRAYYEVANIYEEDEVNHTLVIVAMDVNGLKYVNDNLGHAEGDELIQAAAKAMDEAFSDYGKIFRTGGDEFIALLNCSKQEYDGLSHKFIEAINNANGESPVELSIATGIVRWAEHEDKSFKEIELLADKLMYTNKSAYYIETGKDRRKR